MTFAAVLALAAGLAAPARAAKGAQIVGYELGARAAGLGGAYAAAADDVSALNWNPAGLAAVKNPEAELAQSRWLEGFRLLRAAYAHPVGDSLGAALSFTHVDYGGFEGLDKTGASTGRFGASDLALAGGLGFSLTDELSVGGAVKAFRQSLEDESAAGAAVDAGVLFRRGPVRLGAAMQNVGPPVKFRDQPTGLPFALRAGAAWTPRPDLTLAADVVEEAGIQKSFRMGGEYRTPDYKGLWAALRLGYRVSSGLLGLSYGVAVESARWRLDVAIVPMEEFQTAQWVSFSWRFGMGPVRAARAIEVPPAGIPAYAPPEDRAPIPAYAPKQDAAPIPAYAPSEERAPIPAAAPPVPRPAEETEAPPVRRPQVEPAVMYAEAVGWYRRRESKLSPAQQRAVLRRLIEEYRDLVDVSELEHAFEEAADGPRR